MYSLQVVLVTLTVAESKPTLTSISRRRIVRKALPAHPHRRNQCRGLRGGVT
jgi:hypothetical protein